jgi:hypothetical protein
MHFKGHAEQQMMHRHDELPHSGDAEGNAAADHRGNRRQTQIALANVGPQEEPGRQPHKIEFLCSSRRRCGTPPMAP